MSADETYLEAFTESISTLPNELKRDLAHMKTLDVSYGKVVEELRGLEEDYLDHSYSIIRRYHVQSKERLLKEKEEEQLFIEQQERKRRKKEEGKESNTDSKKSTESENNSNKEKRNTNQSKDKNNSNPDDTKQKSERKYLFDTKFGIPVQVKITQKKPLSSSSSSSKTANLQEHVETETVLVVPTTEELNFQIRNREHLLEIAKLRTEARVLTEEKVAVANQACSLIDAHIQRLDADLEKFESLLKNTGQYQETIAGRNGGIAKPDDLAAIQVTPNSPDWILAKVITHDPNTQMYKLADEDIESNKTFTLPESQVVILGIGGLESTRKGDVIYAVYPDTTSFYQATVVQGPKKVAGGEPFVLVHFKDDGDEHGITHDKAVLIKHIMRVPYGAMK